MDWQVGDLALCIPGPEWEHYGCGSDAEGPTSGQICLVRHIGIVEGLLALWFEEWPGDTDADCFDAREFRRIAPHTEDEEDRETIELLNAEPVVPLVSLERGVG